MKINLTIPTTLNEITLGQYQEYLKQTKNITSESEIQQKVLSIFCGVDLKDTFKMKAVDVQSICDVVIGMFESKFSLINKFNMNGIEFGFEPSLDDMTFGAYVDADKHIGTPEDMHLAMGALFRPIKQKSKELYSIEDYEPSKYDMKQMPLDVVLGVQVFFYNLGRDLSKVMISSFQAEELTYQENQVLLQNGVGFSQFTHSLTEMLQSLKISQN